MSMISILYVAAGGAIGAVLRYIISTNLTPEGTVGFPIGTLTVNLTGCLIIGVMWSLSSQKAVSDAMVLFLMVGMIGSFTTFSTYGLEGIQMIQSGKLMAGFGYVLLSNIAGLLLVVLGKSVTDRIYQVFGG